MKKIVLILFVAIPAMVFAQIKPSTSKAEKALREGKIDEAKSIIDATVGSDDFMKDKKGMPSKNAAKAYFLKGLIYAAMDTTKNEAFQKLDPTPFLTAKAAFDKSNEIEPKAISHLTEPNGFPLLNETARILLAQKYFNKAIAQYQDKKDYKAAFALVENTLYFIPTDTSIVMNAGVYFGPSAEEWQKSIAYIDSYIASGGKNPDAFLQKISIYRDKLKDNEKALAAAKEAMAKHPNNVEFPKFELDMYIKMERLPEAKAAMERQIKADPSNKETWYYLGVINTELKDWPAARKAYEEALKIDSKYFDAQFGLADNVYIDAKLVKQEMNQLGITAADKKKRFELDKVYVEKLKIALPYWEAAEKLSPDDSKVLDILYGIYTDLDDQPKVARITKHMKALGLLD
ncbi:MAG: tetratricopeptide repeat protein [Cyclobacteriaceae bacterium]|nr:tetratricopeptide repeat protein [Cyclobacteriaceae bacterium]